MLKSWYAYIYGCLSVFNPSFLDWISSILLILISCDTNKDFHIHALLK